MVHVFVADSAGWCFRQDGIISSAGAKGVSIERGYLAVLEFATPW
jgi:hypothetical protein